MPQPRRTLPCLALLVSSLVAGGGHSACAQLGLPLPASVGAIGQPGFGLTTFSLSQRPQPTTAPVTLPPPTLPQPGSGQISPGQQCRQAIRAAERAAGIPEQLMAAIGRVESGRREADGSVNPWPWSINAEGTDHIYESKAEALAGVRALQAQGVRSIDIGCMQINLLQHPNAFASLEEAFDPAANAAYAARFLTQLHEQTNAWPAAAAMYHSATPEIGAEYERRVMAVWPEEMRQPHDAPLPVYAGVWPATRSLGGLSPGGMLGGIVHNLPAAQTQPAFASVGAPGVGSGAGSMAGVPGRGLAAYRATPIPFAIPSPLAAPTTPHRVISTFPG
jgi:hypothetical protein